MSERYWIPAEETRVALRVVNSRFIATAGPVFDVAAAKAWVERVRQEFADATHNVPAYVVGHGNRVIAHCSDDGEPAGTAGRPALAVLQGSGLGDTAVVVTRYFGGTKLGTGGLVRAYSDAVRAVLRALPLAERVPTHTAMVAVPYSLFERVRLLAAEHGGEVRDETFAGDVTVTARFPVARFSAFQAALREASAGQIEAVIVESDAGTIMPVGVWGRDRLWSPPGSAA